MRCTQSRPSRYIRDIYNFREDKYPVYIYLGSPMVKNTRTGDLSLIQFWNTNADTGLGCSTSASREPWGGSGSTVLFKTNYTLHSAVMAALICTIA